MKAVNADIKKFQDKSPQPQNVVRKLEADSLQSTLKYAFGSGMALRYASEIRAVQQTKRLPFLKSSNLHEDVLKGYEGTSSVQDDETCISRLDYI